MKNNAVHRRLDAGQIEVVDEAVAAILRQKTPAERIALTAAAHRTARAMLTAQIGSANHGWSNEQVHAEVVRRLTRGAN